MNRVFCLLSWVAPSAASLSAPLFPSMPVWPLIHLKEVALTCFLNLLMMGLKIFAWAVYVKFLSIYFMQFSQRVFIAQSESILM